MTDLHIDAQARLDEIKKRVERVGEQMAADRAQIRCENCRHFVFNFAKYSSERRMCRNPIIRTLAYGDRMVPVAVEAGKAFKGACGGDGLLWQRRRPWDGLRRKDAVYPLAALFIASVVASGFPRVSLFAFLSFVGAFALSALAFMWTMYCSVEGRWSARP